MTDITFHSALISFISWHLIPQAMKIVQFAILVGLIVAISVVSLASSDGDAESSDI